MLARLVPSPLVRFFARPYLAGTTMSSALELASAVLEKKSRLATLDLLGEEVRSEEQVSHNYTTYLDLIRGLSEHFRFKERSLRPSISLKPSAFTCGDRERAFGPIRAIVEQAQVSDIPVTIDMEDRTWTDTTLEHAISLYNEGFDVGTVLQSRLLRTPSDVERIPSGMRIRLVIGIYTEPPKVALTRKSEMKERLIQFADRLLERGAKVEFATHDEVTIRRFVDDVAPRAPDRCELQLLLGVPRERMLERMKTHPVAGELPVRIYIPFSVHVREATAYLRRRLGENPNLALLVLHNLVSRG